MTHFNEHTLEMAIMDLFNLFAALLCCLAGNFGVISGSKSFRGFLA